jgi:hypothetical protein
VTIEAKIVLDSRCMITGKRITTMQLRYPRFVHAEVMTHRVFSRNASSSRAIPVKKLIEEARTETAMPVRFGANQPGMQDKGGDHDAMIKVHDSIMGHVAAWNTAARLAADMAEAFNEAGYHKQICNRILEPFTHINVVVTSTQWANFFALRCHEDADPTMRALADAMFEARQASTVQALTRHDWHLPYISAWDRENLSTQQLLISSAARCARVSYNKHDGSSPSFEDDLALYEKLVSSKLVHASPLEHQAKPDPDGFSEHLWGNFDGFIQFRKTISNEAIHD